jgi:hypothetical protein
MKWRSAARDGGSYNIQARICVRFIVLALGILCLTSCATISRHGFVEPTNNWETRSGQLLYRGPKATLIGEVLVRFSKNGDFELTFSKGGSITLLALRQDASFAEVKGALARMGWAGPVNRAPKPLRGWLELRDALLHAKDQQSVKHVAGAETFLFRF